MQQHVSSPCFNFSKHCFNDYLIWLDMYDYDAWWCIACMIAMPKCLRNIGVLQPATPRAFMRAAAPPSSSSSSRSPSTSLMRDRRCARVLGGGGDLRRRYPPSVSSCCCWDSEATVFFPISDPICFDLRPICFLCFQICFLCFDSTPNPRWNAIPFLSFSWMHLVLGFGSWWCSCSD
jgi:hypothetical protein